MLTSMKGPAAALLVLLGALSVAEDSQAANYREHVVPLIAHDLLEYGDAEILQVHRRGYRHSHRRGYRNQYRHRYRNRYRPYGFYNGRRYRTYWYYDGYRYRPYRRYY